MRVRARRSTWPTRCQGLSRRRDSGRPSAGAAGRRHLALAGSLVRPAKSEPAWSSRFPMDRSGRRSRRRRSAGPLVRAPWSLPKRFETACTSTTGVDPFPVRARSVRVVDAATEITRREAFLSDDLIAGEVESGFRTLSGTLASAATTAVMVVLFVAVLYVPFAILIANLFERRAGFSLVIREEYAGWSPARFSHWQARCWSRSPPRF